ncbi:unnamed protein product, partial [Closterium sp. Naga37s-1]
MASAAPSVAEESASKPADEFPAKADGGKAECSPSVAQIDSAVLPEPAIQSDKDVVSEMATRSGRDGNADRA